MTFIVYITQEMIENVPWRKRSIKTSVYATCPTIDSKASKLQSLGTSQILNKSLNLNDSPLIINKHMQNKLKNQFHPSDKLIDIILPVSSISPLT